MYARKCRMWYAGPGQFMHSEKTREDSELSSLADLRAQHKQKVVAKAEFRIAWLSIGGVRQHKAQSAKTRRSIFSFLSSFFPEGQGKTLADFKLKEQRLQIPQMTENTDFTK